MQSDLLLLDFCTRLFAGCLTIGVFIWWQSFLRSLYCVHPEVNASLRLSKVIFSWTLFFGTALWRLLCSRPSASRCLYFAIVYETVIPPLEHFLHSENSAPVVRYCLLPVVADRNQGLVCSITSELCVCYYVIICPSAIREVSHPQTSDWCTCEKALCQH